MYSRFGRIAYARHVFDGMRERNEASWNTMLSGLVRVGMYWEAMDLFCEMWDCGEKPSGIAIASLITACDRALCMFIEGIQVHGFVVKFGVLDVFVGTSLVHFYGTYGIVSSARKIFERMTDKNVFSWTSMMFGCMDNGDPKEVVNLYRGMRYDDVGCHPNTYTLVITSCRLLDDEFLGHQVIGNVIKSGLETQVSVVNSLISMFGSFGNVEKAHYVFNSMNVRDTISWNSMISANVDNGLCEDSLRCFNLMRHDHNEINSTTLSILLSVCTSVDYLKWGQGIHSLVVKMGLYSNIFVCNTLLGMYTSTGRYEDAWLVFQGMEEKDVISWNSMMACYNEDGKHLDALAIFVNLLGMKKAINSVTFVSALTACSGPEFVIEGDIVHALVILTGMHSDSVVGNALVTMYVKCNMMVEAKKVLQTMPTRDEVTWNALIGGYAENEKPEAAVKAFKLMREEGTPANYITIANLLRACLIPDDLREHGMPIHAFTVLMGFESDEYVQNSLITMYAKCSDLNSSNHIFNGLSNKSAVTWNAMIAANAHHGHLEEALKFLVRMRCAGVDVDEFSFSECLAAAGKLAVLEEGQQLHSLALKLGFDTRSFVTNATMDMYGKCGELDDVLRILPQPKERSVLSWNILISSFARHGYFQEARETFHEMLNLGFQPSHVTFVSLLTACSHGGLVDEGLAHYHSMTKVFGVPQRIDHCVCIVDLLGRSGKLAEAENFIKEMPIPPSDQIWRCLLAACKTHGNLELGRKAAQHILKLVPSDDAAYVLYSNVCANTGKWEDLEYVRREMGSNKIKKKPACSWVKLKNKLSSFGTGDQSHPQASQIYAKLGELRRRIKEAGYVPETSYAMHDTDEEQKEDSLWNHSEKLALAFGLINTPEGSTIKIFKNLRVCGDCHSVYKFISEILSRKIILRDSFRFHHFSSGKCSCSDYW